MILKTQTINYNLIRIFILLCLPLITKSQTTVRLQLSTNIYDIYNKDPQIATFTSSILSQVGYDIQFSKNKKLIGLSSETWVNNAGKLNWIPTRQLLGVHGTTVINSDSNRNNFHKVAIFKSFSKYQFNIGYICRIKKFEIIPTAGYQNAKGNVTILDTVYYAPTSLEIYFPKYHDEQMKNLHGFGFGLQTNWYFLKNFYISANVKYNKIVDLYRQLDYGFKIGHKIILKGRCKEK